jgi:DNA-binding CsgD family transcriptional regulator
MTRRKSAARSVDDLRAAADSARTFTRERDSIICALRSSGMSLRTIAEHAGLSHSAIAKITADTTKGSSK